jgi:hypothetical protein
MQCENSSPSRASKSCGVQVVQAVQIVQDVEPPGKRFEQLELFERFTAHRIFLGSEVKKYGQASIEFCIGA